MTGRNRCKAAAHLTLPALHLLLDQPPHNTPHASPHLSLRLPHFSRARATVSAACASGGMRSAVLKRYGLPPTIFDTRGTLWPI